MKTNFNLSERVLNSKVGKQFVYVLDCITNSSAANDLCVKFDNDLQKVAFVLDEFKGFDYPANKKRIPNLQERLADWLQGLPSNIAIDYATYKIIEIGESWGFCQTERKANEFVNRWFSTIAFRLLQIADKVGYNINALY